MRWNKSRYTFLICSNSRIFVHTIMHIILKQMETYYYHTFKTHKLLQSFGLVQNMDKTLTHINIQTHTHAKVTIYSKCGLGTLPPTYIFIPDIPLSFQPHKLSLYFLSSFHSSDYIWCTHLQYLIEYSFSCQIKHIRHKCGKPYNTILGIQFYN